MAAFPASPRTCAFAPPPCTRVARVPEYSPYAVAEHTLALMLALNRKLVKAHNRVRDGNFSLDGLTGFDMHGKTVGIIGYGSIGQAVARMASAFGMRIMIGARPGARDPIAKDRVAVEELFREADFISLHCPLTPESRNLIDDRRLALMKPTAFLINTARGALVDEAALIAALRSKKIAAAALDVITKEPPPADHPIILAAKELDNLIVTPHTAWSAREARERLLLEVETNVQAFLDGLDRNRVA